MTDFLDRFEFKEISINFYNNLNYFVKNFNVFEENPRKRVNKVALLYTTTEDFTEDPTYNKVLDMTSSDWEELLLLISNYLKCKKREDWVKLRNVLCYYFE
jgi:hypothetical protein